jgi:hypothetical protein
VRPRRIRSSPFFTDRPFTPVLSRRLLLPSFFPLLFSGLVLFFRLIPAKTLELEKLALYPDEIVVFGRDQKASGFNLRTVLGKYGDALDPENGV